MMPYTKGRDACFEMVNRIFIERYMLYIDYDIFHLCMVNFVD